MYKKTTIAFVLLCVAAGGMVATADLHDPTRPDTAVAPPVSAPVTRFVVSAILISDDRRVAIVNGQSVTAGDRIGGATVQAIDAHTVALRFQDKIIHARLKLTKVRE